MTDPIVSTTELTRVYGEGETAVHALRGVDVAFGSGQFAAIMGPSGSGKSTLMHLLAGLDRPTSGSVVVDGSELAHLDDRALTRLRRDRLGFVFQAFNLVPVLTAEENITLPLTLAGKKPEGDWLQTLIAAVGLGDRLDHRPAELSGGQQQRVAVARALIHRPGGGVRRRADRQPRLARPPTRCSGCCARPPTSSARPSSWSPTTPTPPRSPTASWCSATAASCTTAPARPPRACST